MDAKQIGKNLATLRGTMTQKELALAMGKRGQKWSQSTVWAAEAGERKIRLDEAHDIAEILGCTMEEFFTNTQIAQLQRNLSGGAFSLQESWVSTMRSLVGLMESRRSLQTDIGKAEARTDAVEELASWLDTGRQGLERHTVAAAVESAVLLFKDPVGTETEERPGTMESLTGLKVVEADRVASEEG